MFAQTQQTAPQHIARIVEDTISNLRELEGRLDVLRTDLAWLCQSIGLPEVAQKALTPRLGSTGMIGQQFGVGNPFASNLPWNVGQNPYQVATPGVGTINPFVGQVPYGQSPVSPFAGVPGGFPPNVTPYQQYTR